MVIVKDIKTLQKLLQNEKINGNKIGFVPTMGALHNGHIKLITTSCTQNEITVCSIFVNPTQFNNAEDFKKYPITLDSDIEKLELANCNYLFLPTVTEMYPENENKIHYNLGEIETVLEGKYRPGHFQGVCIIVDKLLIIVNPTTLYLGRKDYQQCMVINKMMQLRKHTALLKICDTIREKDGLAMSSRNMRLNAKERIQALKIIESLEMIKNGIQIGSLTKIKEKASIFLKENNYKVDYAEIADADTLEIQTTWDGKRKLVALVAAYLNEVRLIDNIVL
ncbi:MAG: pantoate--beta-alanine ligase [Ferruginibacter sp.]|nr:pantoate--beta-alanine ligase [Ferruginibacter sp.]